MTSWLLFGGVILFALFLDGYGHQKQRINIKQSLIWSVFWIFLSLTFNYWIYLSRGAEAALQFFTAYLVEKALSVDNLFLFLVIFSAFHIPTQYRHKILFWGVWGAIIMRALCIAGGIALIATFSWMFYLFGGFLLFTAFQLARKSPGEMHPEQSPLLLWIERHLPAVSSMEGGNFFIKKNHTWHLTPLAIALISVELTDVVFALDSIPAVLGITVDPYIVYTSNIFAILGLRSLYFTLEHSIQRFYYLHYSLAAILAFIGMKMLCKDLWHVPIDLSLGIIAALLLPSLFLSKKSK